MKKVIIAVDLYFEDLSKNPAAARSPVLSIRTRLILTSSSPSCQLFLSLNIFFIASIFLFALRKQYLTILGEKKKHLCGQIVIYLHSPNKPTLQTLKVCMDCTSLSQGKQYAAENTIQLRRLTPSLTISQVRKGHENNFE